MSFFKQAFLQRATIFRLVLMEKKIVTVLEELIEFLC